MFIGLWNLLRYVVSEHRCSYRDKRIWRVILWKTWLWRLGLRRSHVAIIRNYLEFLFLCLSFFPLFIYIYIYLIIFFLSWNMYETLYEVWQLHNETFFFHHVAPLHTRPYAAWNRHFVDKLPLFFVVVARSCDFLQIFKVTSIACIVKNNVFENWATRCYHKFLIDSVEKRAKIFLKLKKVFVMNVCWEPAYSNGLVDLKKVGDLFTMTSDRVRPSQ